MSDEIPTEASVTKYLSDNPEFFTNKAELLLAMIIPHESGKAISLLERQVNLLREKNNESQENISNFIANAKANDELFKKIRTIIIALLKTSSLKALSALIESDLKDNFSASVSRLVFVSDADAENNQTSDANSYKRIPLSAAKEALGEQFGRNTSFCGSVGTRQAELLFPQTETGVVSAAIIPIHQDAKSEQASDIPLLLIGSNKEDHFHSNLDTLFLDFIGEVLAVHLSSLGSI
jgi:uncharacterized protein